MVFREEWKGDQSTECKRVIKRGEGSQGFWKDHVVFRGEWRDDQLLPTEYKAGT